MSFLFHREGSIDEIKHERMEMNVQKWVRLASGIGKSLLNGEDKQMDDEVSNG
ncbi:MAG: hypothetical protein ACLUDU_06410 [Butyricimonas faecihominis]